MTTTSQHKDKAKREEKKNHEAHERSKFGHLAFLHINKLMKPKHLKKDTFGILSISPAQKPQVNILNKILATNKLKF
ncbi:CLUMA_CG000255, isoform A [Clunio marinus]|uniref:CLUMA_CG000255, isoform A n=1 Tax=Clunio marinus TaxID=568069 RepID=A0A1J1HIT7_9DIPT|nr:CLUMA_CG000255, isoform A [Clunio marinus]